MVLFRAFRLTLCSNVVHTTMLSATSLVPLLSFCLNCVPVFLLLGVGQCEFIQSGELPDVDIMIDDIGMLSDRLCVALLT